MPVKVQIIEESSKSYRIKLLEDGFHTSYCYDSKGDIKTVRKKSVDIDSEYDYSDAYWND